MPASYRAAIVARLKIMCDLDISEKRKPQDGKIKFKKFGPLDIELRVATIPTAGGVEDIVMRILAAGEPIPLDKMGFSDAQPRAGEGARCRKPYGLFFVCGPTGSGKTTTLHSVLRFLNTPDTKIWTAEDPVEITQKGLRQVQMNQKAGPRLRRRHEGVPARRPGHHHGRRDARQGDHRAPASRPRSPATWCSPRCTPTRAPESIIRLLDMGMDPFNFADALLGILAQRLAKRLCSCKQPTRRSAGRAHLPSCASTARS